MTRQDLTATAIRYTAGEINAYIRGVRGAIYRGKSRLAVRCIALDYLRLVKDLHELQAIAIEEGMTGELVEGFEPVPFRPQLVGQPGANAWVM